MKYKINEQGYFLEDYLGDIEEGQEQFYVSVKPPQPCYKPRWNGSEWIEEGSAPELPPIEPTTDDRLMALEDTILMILMEG